MDADQSKLFVGGISRETSEDTLKDHFGKYGTVLGSAISKDRITNNPRGFGFVWFSDPSSTDKALADAHVILGRTVDVKRAIPRSEQPRNHQQTRGSSRSSSSFENSNSQFRTRKLFVGGLSASLTEEGFKNYFEQFGIVTDVVVMYDNTTHRPRGFGFITFASEESVENVMEKSFHELNGRYVEVKRAVPKAERNSNDSGYTGYSPSNYPPYTYSPTPAYEALPSPAPYRGVGAFMYGASVYGGWYPSVGYGGIPYGFAPIAPQPWMFPYGSSFYPRLPSYMSGGDMAAADYNGILGPAAGGGKLNHAGFGNGHAPASVKSSRGAGEKLGADSASNSAALNKKSSKRS